MKKTLFLSHLLTIVRLLEYINNINDINRGKKKKKKKEKGMTHVLKTIYIFTESRII